MNIKFSDLLTGKERKKSIDMSFDIKSFYFDGDKINSIEKVNVEGQVTTESDEVLALVANVTTKLQLTCSRCLETFIYPIDIEIEERFTKNKNLQDEENILYVEGDSLNITEIIESSIVSCLPIKRLCKKSCKGLCTTCGKNLNIDGCQCDDFDVDLRMAKLKDFFANKEV